MTQHTPTQYELAVALDHLTRKRGIAFIVKACNAHEELVAALKYVVAWHREHDSGEGELFGLDFVTTCISALAKAEEVTDA